MAQRNVYIQLVIQDTRIDDKITYSRKLPNTIAGFDEAAADIEDLLEMLKDRILRNQGVDNPDAEEEA